MQSGLHALQPFQCFVEALPLQVMNQHRIGIPGQLLNEIVDLLPGLF